MKLNFKSILIGSVLLWFVTRKPSFSITGLKKTRFIPVYKELPKANKSGKTNITFSRNKSGVYIIKEDDEIVYVGLSYSDLYNTIMRHFQTWNDPQSKRVTYKNKLNRHDYKVRIILADERRIPLLEAGLQEKYLPRDNKSFTFDQFSEKQIDTVITEIDGIEFTMDKNLADLEDAPF